jgi:hypothetical protein
MGPTRHTNFPGRAGVGRFLAPTVFQSAQKAVARRLTTWTPRYNDTSPLQRPARMPPPRTAAPSELAHSPHDVLGCLRKASCRRAPPHDPFAGNTANAGNSSVHTDLDLPSVASSSSSASSQLELSSRCYPPFIHTPVVSHLCLSPSIGRKADGCLSRALGTRLSLSLAA